MGLVKVLSEKSSYLGYLCLVLLVILGLMNFVHNITYLEPSDGGVWEMVDGQLTVTAVDLEADTSLQVGDVLVNIDDSDPLTTKEAYIDYLHEETIIGKKHLYVLERGGHKYEPWIEIQGVRQDKDIYILMLLAVSGFFYLLFLFLLLSQDVTFGSKRSLVAFSLSVYLTFVFHHTLRFSTLDYIGLLLSSLGSLLLPSTMMGVALNQSFDGKSWKPYLQLVHWIPTMLLIAAAMITLISDNADFLKLADLRGLWGGLLILGAVILLVLTSELRSKEKNFSLFWAISWAPYALVLLNLSYPGRDVVSALTPMILPLAFLLEWRGRDELHLGHIGKKVLIYVSVVFVLMTGYFLFLGLFEWLGTGVSQKGQSFILGLGIMFAAVSYSPLSRYAAELADRMIYGKRFQSIRILSDFSGINRADTNIDEFLHIILNRIKNAFLIENGTAWKAEGNSRRFRTISMIQPESMFIFESLSPDLLQGEIVSGRHLEARILGQEGVSPFQPGDYICPIRVTDSLAALLVLTPEGNELKFNLEELRLLKSLLHQCGVLMENMELYQSLHQKAESINQLKEYNENIIESSRVGIMTTDDMGRLVSCNNALVTLAALDREMLMGKTFEQIFKGRQVKVQRQMKSGFAMEGTFLNSEDEALLLEIEKTPLRTRDNDVYGTLYLIEDIRERKRFDEQMLQQEKLASIGMLAAGVAHEINTPLTGIASYSQMMMGDDAVTEDQRELLELIQDQSQRAANIVKELLNFSRKDTDAQPKGPVDLMALLEQTLRFLDHQLEKHKVMVNVVQPSERAEFEGHANQMQQVFMNLIVNAMDAMPDGGSLEIGARVDGPQIEIWFEDEGIGMDEKTKSRIFDPFFTTKEVGRGTGLGLAVVFKILQDHNGAINVQSRPGKGCRFTLHFYRTGFKPPFMWGAETGIAMNRKFTETNQGQRQKGGDSG